MHAMRLQLGASETSENLPLLEGRSWSRLGHVGVEEREKEIQMILIMGKTRVRTARAHGCTQIIMRANTRTHRHTRARGYARRFSHRTKLHTCKQNKTKQNEKK